jgi:hypothetical protein
MFLYSVAVPGRMPVIPAVEKLIAALVQLA